MRGLVALTLLAACPESPFAPAPLPPLSELPDDLAAMSFVMVNGEAVWEWTPETGAVTTRWSSFDFLDPVTRDGRVLWHLEVGGAVSSMYRATPLEQF